MAKEYHAQHPDVTIKAGRLPERGASEHEDSDRAPVEQPTRRLPELGRRLARRPGEGGQGGRPDEVRGAVDQEHRRFCRGLAGQRQAVRDPRTASAWSGSGTTRSFSPRPESPRRQRPGQQLFDRGREAEGRGYHSDRDRRQGPVAGRLLLGLPGHEALQQADDATVCDLVQLQRSLLDQGRHDTWSSCSPPSPSRTASSATPGTAGRDQLGRTALRNGKAAMELQGHWNPGVMQSLTPDEPDRRASSAGSRSRTSRAARRCRARCSAAATASPARVKAPQPQCAQFLAYVDSPGVQRRIGSTSFGLPCGRAPRGR